MAKTLCSVRSDVTSLFSEACAYRAVLLPCGLCSSPRWRMGKLLAVEFKCMDHAKCPWYMAYTLEHFPAQCLAHWASIASSMATLRAGDATQTCVFWSSCCCSWATPLLVVKAPLAALP